MAWQPPAKLVVLSGGNPQVPKGDGEAPVRNFIGNMPGWQKSIGVELDKLVAQQVPGVRKAVRWNTPFYGVDGRGWFLGFHCFDKYVKVTFLRGEQLNPLPPVASKQIGARYIHFSQGEEVGSQQMRDWISQAAANDGEPLF